MTTEAELLANLPADGVRVFRREMDFGFHLRAVLPDGTYWYSMGDPWYDYTHTGRRHPGKDRDAWTEITPTPTLPDPSGDLPDGARVRMVFEGEVKAWVNGSGNILTAKGNLYFGRADASHATVEVLALPTPPPSALEGKPGSLWRDPETGNLWVRRDMHNEASRFAQVQGKWFCGGSLCREYDTPIIARLVPAQVADDE